MTVKEWRKSHGLTFRAAAQLIGVSVRAIEWAEQGRPCKVDTAARFIIGSEGEVELEDLVTDKKLRRRLRQVPVRIQT